MKSLTIGLFVCLLLVNSRSSIAAEPLGAAQHGNQQLQVAFSKSLSGSTLVGHFTIDGQDDAARHAERYEIQKVTKMEQGDYWMFQARIKYGDKNLVLPMPLEVKWAGNTPVITLDKVTLPGLGTFNARVVIDGDRYAGTWQHGDVGGHMYGKIEKSNEAAAKKAP